MRIGFCTTDWSLIETRENLTLGGSGHYRVGIPSKYLAKAGHEVYVGGIATIGGSDAQLGVTNPYIEDPSPTSDTSWGCDVIVLQRTMHEGLAPALQAARANGQLIVSDVDDWFWGLDKRNLAHHGLVKNVSEGYNLKAYMENLKASSIVTVSTPFLADQLSTLIDTPIVVVPNVVDLEQDWRPRAQPRKPAFGWAGAIPWRSGDIETMVGVLGYFLKDNHVRFHHSGDAPWAYPDGSLRPSFTQLAGLEGAHITTSPMVPVHDVPRLYDWFDVGIVPLNDVPFNHAKSYVKGLEYAAAGLPFVAQGTNEYRRLAGDGVGLVAHNKNQWRARLHDLLDQSKRVELAERGQGVVAERYSAQACWRQWEDVYSMEMVGV